MTTILGKDKPVLFLGLADHWQHGTQPFPVGAIDLFRLSRHKIHIIYPGILKRCPWVFLFDKDFVQSDAFIGLTVRIIHEDTGTEFAQFTIDEAAKVKGPPSDAEVAALSATTVNPSDPVSTKRGGYMMLDDTPFLLFANEIDGLVIHPGRYRIEATYGGKTDPVGTIDFHYRGAPALTPDQIKAIESDPTAAKVVQMDFGCKFCASKFKVYTALKRSRGVDDSALWYADVPEHFACECGRTRFPLRYVRESMHGLLLKDLDRSISGLSYIRQYGHAQVAAVAQEFVALLDSGVGEAQIQRFIEKNPMLLSRFHAKRLFVKPNIVGRFQADFAVLDSQSELFFIEIERPNLRLFRKNGHPSAGLMHAYGQVNDWLRQYSKYGGAIQEALKLRPEDIVSVRGAVIAGRSASVTHDVLQRHYTAPPYPGVQFMTFDDLASSVVVLSKKLA